MTEAPDTFVIGTRGSDLALWQANAVADAIRTALPHAATEVRVITTTGDRIRDVPLEKIGDKGLFTKELERALLDGEVDMCVHSMKDLPTQLPAGCALRAMLPRADARDALVCGPRIAEFRALEDLPAGTRIGTGSMRRTAQIRAQFPQIEPVPIRGNLGTRLAKANGPDYEGALLAVAGIERMGEQACIAARLPVECMVPAVGQGAVGVEVREGDERVEAVCRAIDDAETSACVNIERQVLDALGGSCFTPIGVYARFVDGELAIDAAVCSIDGSRMARVHCAGGDVADVLEGLRRQGADEILDEARAIAASEREG